MFHKYLSAAFPGNDAGSNAVFELLAASLLAKQEASRQAEREFFRKITRMLGRLFGRKSSPGPNVFELNGFRAPKSNREPVAGDVFPSPMVFAALEHDKLLVVPEIPLPRSMAERYWVNILLEDVGFVRPPPRRFRTLVLADYVDALFDPYEFLCPARRQARPAPPPAVVVSVVKSAPRTRRLSIPEKTFQLVHVALGFFGSRKVDARNCP